MSDSDIESEDYFSEDEEITNKSNKPNKEIKTSVNDQEEEEEEEEEEEDDEIDAEERAWLFQLQMKYIQEEDIDKIEDEVVQKKSLRKKNKQKVKKNEYKKFFGFSMEKPKKKKKWISKRMAERIAKKHNLKKGESLKKPEKDDEWFQPRFLPRRHFRCIKKKDSGYPELK